MDVTHKDKILIVDDEEILRYLLSTKLEEEGYEVKAAKNGLECLETLQHFNPDLIILDINMPLMDGIATAKEIRKLKPFTKTPIIFLTGVGSIDSLRIGFEAGGDEYLNKPVNVDELMIRINALLRMHRAEMEVEQLSKHFHFLLVQDFLNYSTAVKIPLTMLVDESLGPINEQQKEVLNLAIKALDENIQLLQETALLMKLDPKKIAINKTPTNLTALIKDTTHKLIPQLKHKDLNFVNQLPENDITLELDQEHIRQTIYLLFNYIIDKAHPKSNIQLWINLNDSKVNNHPAIEFIIKTNSNPISEEEMYLMLDRYEQARLNRVSYGKNLSLTICKLIIEAHNGKFWCECKEGDANYFKFSFPMNLNKNSNS